jgi:hypothetical protein
MAAVLPRNLALILQRLSNFHRTTVRVRPQSNDTVMNGQTIVWRLPTNTLVDLHNIQFMGKCDVAFTTGYTIIGFPRNLQSLIERVDIVINGQVINGSNADYGGLVATIDTNINGYSGTDANHPGNFLQDGTALIMGSGYQGLVDDATRIDAFTPNYENLGERTLQAPWVAGQSFPFLWNRFLGFLSGRHIRFVDTAVLGPVEIRFRLAPASVLFGQKVANDVAITKPCPVVSYTLSNVYMYLDTVSFTDDFYRAILAKRLIDGGVITIPYDNYFSFQKAEDGSVGMTDTMTFNLGTQSLDYLIATMRDSRYQQPTIKLFSKGAEDSSYFHFVSGAGSNVYPNTTYQFLINNQLVPTWPANINEAYALSRAAWDKIASRKHIGRQDSTTAWRNGQFAFVQCFKHHDGDGDRIISGLDTRGASSNMQYMISGCEAGCSTYNAVAGVAGAPGVGPTPIYRDVLSGNGQYMITVWACTTSTLEISAGQNMVTIW